MKVQQSRDKRNAVFEREADTYDAWYDSAKGLRVFRVELACLKMALQPEPPRPWLEVGVGTGRFSSALGIEDGLDSAAAPLKWAELRGARVKQGRAESLPYEDGRFGAVFLIMTLCFLSHPLLALREAVRVLKPGGAVVIGFVSRESLWGQAYVNHVKEGHTFYADARFYTTDDVRGLAGRVGLSERASSGCLFEGPEARVEAYAPPRLGETQGAGFVAMRFLKG